MKSTLALLTFLLLAASLGALHAAETAKNRADRCYNGFSNIVRDLQYKTVADFADPEQLSMDLILPENTLYPNGAPVVFYIHGGGWGGGERFVLNKNTFQNYTNKGIAVACISYRLASKGGSSALDCLIDCKDAARFLAKNAGKYNLDPSRFATTGHSAGGHLSLCTALVPNNHPLLMGDPSLAGQSPVFVCVSALAPLVTLYHPEEADGNGTLSMNTDKFKQIIGGTSAEQPTKDAMASNAGREHYISSIQSKAPTSEIAKTLSPEFWLTKMSPPVQVIHGTEDSLISIRGARYFQSLAGERGAKVNTIEVENGLHNFRSKDSQKTPGYTEQEIEQMSSGFLIKNLLEGLQPKTK